MARFLAIPAAVVALLSPASALAGVSFTGAQSFDVGPGPTQLVAGDINRDGLIDFVTLNDTAVAGEQISLLLADGDGTFSATNIAGPSNARSLALADINGDQTVDLAVANTSSTDGVDGLAVFLNDGHGGFGSPAYYDISDGDNPWGVAALDTLGYGVRDALGTDLAVTGDHHGGTGSRTTIFRNDGHGTLTEQPAVDSFANARSITPVDLNGDLLADLVEVNGGAGGGVHDLMNVSGAFSALTSVSIPGLDDLRWTAAGDLTGDGAPDIAMPSVSEDKVYVAPTNGAGAFKTPQPYNVGDAPVGVAIADLDRDGRRDLLTANSGATNDVSLLLGSSGGQLNGVPGLALPPAAGAQSIAAVDLNADSYPDVAVADTAASKVSVFYAIPPAVSITPTELSFGGVGLGSSATRTVTITNHGPQWLFIAVEPQVTGSEQEDFVVQAETCGVSIAPGTSCSFDVAFTPSDKGVRLGFISLSTSGRGAPGVIPLTGQGVVPSVVFAQPIAPAQAVLGARVTNTVRCVVPKLGNKTIKQAKKLLKKAHCRLGKVKKARISKKAKAKQRAKLKTKRYKTVTVIYKQSPKAKKKLKRNAKVKVTVRTKLKKVRKSARKH